MGAHIWHSYRRINIRKLFEELYVILFITRVLLALRDTGLSCKGGRLDTEFTRTALIRFSRDVISNRI
jgi:hypothetical protein